MGRNEMSAEKTVEEIAEEIVPVINLMGANHEPESRKRMRLEMASALRTERERAERAEKKLDEHEACWECRDEITALKKELELEKTHQRVIELYVDKATGEKLSLKRIVELEVLLAKQAESMRKCANPEEHYEFTRSTEPKKQDGGGV